MSTVTSFIAATLAQIEKDRAVKIWFAIESGSRAWGFESTDSDYDIRFIYLSPLREYLTVYPRRDVIENADVVSPDPLLDFSGWDLRKFLGLTSKSNPVCFEWMQSLIVYQEAPIWKRVRELLLPWSPLEQSGYCPISANQVLALNRRIIEGCHEWFVSRTEQADPCWFAR